MNPFSRPGFRVGRQVQLHRAPTVRGPHIWGKEAIITVTSKWYRGSYQGGPPPYNNFVQGPKYARAGPAFQMLLQCACSMHFIVPLINQISNFQGHYVYKVLSGVCNTIVIGTFENCP